MISKGFTLIEIIIVLGIFSILSALVYVNLIPRRNTISLETTAQSISADIKGQQVKSLTRFYGNSPVTIIFTSTSYILQPQNQTITLPADLTFTNITFPSSLLTFSLNTGQASAWSVGTSSVTLSSHNSAETKTIFVDKYGKTSIN